MVHVAMATIPTYRLQTDCISNSISSNGKMWSEMSSEKLWSEFLGDVKQGSKLKEQIRSRSVPSTTIIMNKHRVQGKLLI